MQISALQAGLNKAHANNEVRIGCTVLPVGKKGVVPADAAGYYTLVVGAYGTHNSAGMFYDQPTGASMFAEGSPLMRRLRKGVLFLEFKHPEPFVDLMIDGRIVRKPLSDGEYLSRIRRIDDDRVCGHIRELRLIDGVDENGRACTFVVAEVIPYGPFGHIFKASLDNPSINTYCSVRSITQDDMMRGIKYTREISTWDFVGEGGILGANKYNSPALEEFTPEQLIMIPERVITPVTLWSIQDEAKRMQSLGLENADHMNVDQLIEDLHWQRKPAARKPHYLRGF